MRRCALMSIVSEHRVNLPTRKSAHATRMATEIAAAIITYPLISSCLFFMPCSCRALHQRISVNCCSLSSLYIIS